MTARSLILTTVDEIERIAFEHPGTEAEYDMPAVGLCQLILGGVRFLAPLAAGSAA